MEYPVSLNSAVTDNYANFDLEFTNKLDPTDKVKVTMTKAASLPVLEAAATGTGSAFNSAVTITDAQTATVNMYKANDSKVFVKMTCAEAAAFDAVAGLTVTKSGDEYEVKVTDATQIPAGATTELIAKNSSDNTRQAKLTITWLDPAIDFTVTKDVSSAVTKSGDALNVVYTTLDGGNFEVTITGPVGSTIDYSAISETSWLGVLGSKKPTELTDDGSGKGEATIGFRDDAGATNDAVVITVTNAVDTDNTYKTKTITINKN